MAPPRKEIYKWFKVGLPKNTVFQLKEYVKQHPTFTEAYESAAIKELVTEALNYDAVKRNIEFVRLLEEMDQLSVRDKEGLRIWTAKKDELLGVV